MIITVLDNGGAQGRALAEKKGWEYIDLLHYIEHKLDLSIGRIKSEGEEHYCAVEAEAVRDVLMTREVTGGNLVFSMPGSTYRVPLMKELIDRQSAEIMEGSGD